MSSTDVQRTPAGPVGLPATITDLEGPPTDPKEIIRQTWQMARETHSDMRDPQNGVLVRLARLEDERQAVKKREEAAKAREIRYAGFAVSALIAAGVAIVKGFFSGKSGQG